MAVAHMTHTPDAVVLAIRHILKEQAARELLTDAQWRGLDVKVNAFYDMNHMAMRLRIAWSDPKDRSNARCLDHIIPEDFAKKDDLLVKELDEVMKNISLRGELFFFRIAKHFPKHVSSVKCDGEGNVAIYFKNGQKLACPEDDIESTEFLAKCGMIYDL